MTILISGAGGFLGKNLIDYFLNYTKYNIIAMTSQSQKIMAKYLKYGARIQVVESFHSEIDWSTVDILINCAFPRNSDGVQIAKGLSFISNLLTEATCGGVGAVLNISSQSVYSQSRLVPATEQTELNLESKYAVGKYASELMTNSICRNIPHTNIRLASLIGPEFGQRVINKFVAQAIEGKNLQIIGGIQKYGFLDIRDAVSGIATVCAHSCYCWNEVYNLGMNEDYTLEEIAQYVCSLSEKYCTKSIKYEVKSSDQVHNSSLECAFFQETFQWKPVYKLIDMVIHIYETYSQLKKKEK